MSVVIPAYNSWHTLPRLLASLAEGSVQPDEIFVVDDGSEAFVPLRQEGLNLHWVRLQHQGPIAARNAGWTATSSRWVVFLDSDCTVDRHWCAAYRNAMSEHADAAILEGPLRETYRRGFFRHWAENTRPGRFPTANVAYRRDVLLAVQGLDPQFRWGRFYFREDSDLALRAHAHGASVWVADALAFHHGRKIGFGRKLSEACRYALDPALIARHGWRGLAVDGMRFGPLRVPAPRQGTACLVTALWVLTLVVAPRLLPYAIAAAVFRAGLVLSREGLLVTELPAALLEQLLEPILLFLALVFGTARLLAPRQKGAVASVRL